MTRARRHQSFSAAAAFVLLALVTELVGRSMIGRIDVGRHISTPSCAGAGYYPILLAAVKLGVALLLTRLAWRFVRARSAARGARRLLAALGTSPATRAPRLRFDLSPRLWFACFALTAVIYLFQTDAEGASEGRWPLLAPWLHSSALPVFAVLAVGMALIWSAVRSWLAEYESYARETVAYARRLASMPVPTQPTLAADTLTPRRLFGVVVESRPPPLPA
jgi:hypothetical protein